MSFRCRVCGCEAGRTWMDFGLQPISMKLLRSENQPELMFPLALADCPSCGFIFIPEGLSPGVFYDETQQSTSFSPPLHLSSLVSHIKDRFSGRKSPFIYEIGCNDGYLLGLLREAGFQDVRGVDPSRGCVDQARRNGLMAEAGYFTRTTAEAVLLQHGHPDLLICRHVLEHVRDLDDFLKGVSLLLEGGAVLLLETPDLNAMEEKGDFSVIWEQHVNYFDPSIMRRLLSRFGLKVDRWERLQHGGGSLLFTITSGCNAMEPVSACGRERLRLSFQRNIRQVRESMEGFRADGLRIMGFGAGMRGTMFLNLSGIGSFLEGVVDDNPDKIGRFLPGSRLPIVSEAQMALNPPDLCMILPLNLKETEHHVMERMAWFSASGGRFIEVLPDGGNMFEIRNV